MRDLHRVVDWLEGHGSARKDVVTRFVAVALLDDLAATGRSLLTCGELVQGLGARGHCQLVESLCSVAYSPHEDSNLTQPLQEPPLSCRDY